MLAAVQAFTLKHLIFGDETKDTAPDVIVFTFTNSIVMLCVCFVRKLGMLK